MLKKLIIIIILFLILTGCSRQKFDEEAWKQKVEATSTESLYAVHSTGDQYFNPWMQPKASGFTDYIERFTISSPPYTEEEKSHRPEILENTREQILKTGDQDFILWIGHGSFMIKTGTQVWLLDPVLSKCASLLPRSTPAALTASDVNELFPRVNVVISHNHYDHLDADTISDLSENTRFFVPLGLKRTLREWQPNAEITEMDWWDRLEFDGGFELHSLPAQHWSLRLFENRNSSLWSSYMIVTPKKTIYFGGDSGYFLGYREFGKKFDKIDYALLPISAYHPRKSMHYVHMNVEEAIRAFDDLQATYFIPTQWGTFQLGDNPIGQPALDLAKYIRVNQLDPARFMILNIGQMTIL